jgi:hypothetical protein
VSGNIVSGGAVTPGDGVSVLGTVLQNAAVGAPQAPEIPGLLVGTAQLNIAPDSVVSLAPGAFRSITVNSRATVNLASGDYFVDSLDLEPQAALAFASPTVRIVVGSNLTLRGSIGSSSPWIAYLGSNDLVIEHSLAATIVAPNARVTLGAGSELSFSGIVYARDVVLRPDVVFQCAQP